MNAEPHDANAIPESPEARQAYFNEKFGPPIKPGDIEQMTTTGLSLAEIQKRRDSWVPPIGVTFPYGWRCDATGIWTQPDDDKKFPVQVAKTPCWVVARNREDDSKNWGTTITWIDSDGKEHKRAFSDERYNEPGLALIRELSKEGLRIVPSKASAFIDYLFSFETDRRFRVVTNIGWTNSSKLVFVTPNAVIRSLPKESDNA